MSKERELSWGIVGGGMMGLTLALRLAQAGQRVTVLEAAPSLGGLASTWQIGNVTWDKHYHVALLSDRFLRDLLHDLDLDEDIRWVETKTGFLTDGQLHSMSNSWEFLKFPPLSLWGKFRLASTIFYASKIKRPDRLENILVSDWLKKFSGTAVFNKIWLPLLKAKLGNAYQRVSAAFIWTTISRMYRARNSGLKKEMFGYVAGGYQTILDRLHGKLNELGVEVRTSCPVQRVDGGQVETQQGESLAFDRVVMTLPSSKIPMLCPTLSDPEKEVHQNIEYLGIICASMVTKQKLADYYVTNITEPNVPFTAVIEMTALVRPEELADQHLVYLPRYLTADDPAWTWSDEEIEQRFIESIDQLYPDFDREQVTAFRISRVKQVMALPTLNYSQAAPSTKTSVENLFVVNSAQIVKGTLNVNEVIEIADQAIQNHLLPSISRSRDDRSNSLSTTNEINHGEAAGELVTRS